MHFRVEGGRLFITATDGRRIFQLTTPSVGVGLEKCEFLMPRELAEMALRMRGDVISVSLENELLTVAERHPLNAMSCTMPVAVGKFPAIEDSLALRPGNEKMVLRVDTKYLRELLETLVGSMEQYDGERSITTIEIPDNEKYPYLFTTNADGDAGTWLRAALMSVSPVD